MFLAYKEPNRANSSELASFVHLGPACMLLYARIHLFLKKQGERSRYAGCCLFLLLLAEMIFMVFGIPSWLAEITLMRYNNRMALSFGLTSVLFTVWCLFTAVKHRVPFTKTEAVLRTMEQTAGCTYFCAATWTVQANPMAITPQ